MIPADLDALLHPVERFEAIRRRVVFLGDRLCDLSHANPYTGTDEATRAVLRKALESRRLLDLQYSPFGGHTVPRRMVAAHLTGVHAAPFRFDDVLLTPGATAALHVALRAAAAPGAEVIVPVPCWLDYPLYCLQAGLKPVLVPLREGTFDLDVDAIADAAAPGTRAVLLAHPANPTGRSYQAGTLQALAQGLERAGRRLGAPITLIADEVHRDFVPPESFASAVAAWPRTLVVYSFGKYHAIQGQRLGYVAVSPRHPERRNASAELARWLRIMGYLAPTAVMQQAVPGLLALRHDLRGLAAWRTRFTEELVSAGYEVAPAEGTFFLYVRTPGRGSVDDFQFIEQLARTGVLALPAPVFHHRGYFRLSLTGAVPLLERALGTLCRTSMAWPSYA